MKVGFNFCPSDVIWAHLHSSLKNEVSLGKSVHFLGPQHLEVPVPHHHCFPSENSHIRGFLGVTEVAPMVKLVKKLEQKS